MIANRIIGKSRIHLIGLSTLVMSFLLFSNSLNAQNKIPSKIKVHIQNNTKKNIYLALSYIPYGSLNSSFVNKYWYTIKAGEKAFIFETQNGIFYYYAETTTTNFLGQRDKWGDNYYVNIDGERYGFGECIIEKSDCKKIAENEYSFTLSIKN